MSKVTFINKSTITVSLCVGDNTYTVYPSHSQCVESEGKSFRFSICPDSMNSVGYIFRSAGVISKRHFVAVASYNLECDDECEVTLYTNIKKGKFRDEYEYCVPYCQNGSLTDVVYSVRDGESFLRELEASAKKSRRALFLFDILDIIGNAFVGILILVIPFLLIWLFGSLQLAWDICSIAFIPVFIIIVVINRLFDKLKKKVWYKGKKFALRNQIFKDYNSYFSSEYIYSVINNIK